MARRLLIILIAVSAVAIFAVSVIAADTAKVTGEKAKHEYVGVKSCKICHTKDGVHPSWLETKHAKAWDNLKPEQQKDAKCVTCHSTGTTATGELLTGVQCEACHGPGSAYKAMSIMKDKKVAMENGLLIPDEKTCLKCHNENVPPEFRSKEKWDYARMKTIGVHAMAADSTAAKTGAK